MWIIATVLLFSFDIFFRLTRWHYFHIFARTSTHQSHLLQKLNWRDRLQQPFHSGSAVAFLFISFCAFFFSVLFRSLVRSVVSCNSLNFVSIVLQSDFSSLLVQRPLCWCAQKSHSHCHTHAHTCTKSNKLDYIYIISTYTIFIYIWRCWAHTHKYIVWNGCALYIMIVCLHTVYVWCALVPRTDGYSV